jgi:CBS domain-containing protein
VRVKSIGGLLGNDGFEGRRISMTVRQLLNEKGHDVFTIGPDNTVFEAMQKMADQNAGSLVVIEDGNPLASLLNDITHGTYF